MLALLLTAPMAAQLQPQQLWPPPVRPPWPPHFKPIMNNSIPGPASPEEYGAWWAWVQSWRETQLKLLNLSRPGGTALDNPKLEWTRTSFVQAQVPLYDRFLYDRATGRYTVRRFLDDLRMRYGGLDSILLWGCYPNLGIDDRNQFDTWASTSGGLAGLASLIKELQSSGVRVLLPLHPWDTGTRHDADLNAANLSSVARFFQSLGADGLNDDCADDVPADLYTLTSGPGALAGAPPLALEPPACGVCMPRVDEIDRKFTN